MEGQWVEVQLSFSMEDFRVLKDLASKRSMAFSSFLKQIISEYVSAKNAPAPERAGCIR